MSVFKYLIENNLVEEKEFQELLSIRAIKVNDEHLTDPQMKIKNIEKIEIGLKIFEL